jgi:hypothetical protein
MGRRLDLHEVLCSALGSRNVYFQPPESLKLKYPAIIYEKHNIDITPADNLSYLKNWVYQITVVDKNPDSLIVEKISELPGVRYVRAFKSDNLNHDVFLITY